MLPQDPAGSSLARHPRYGLEIGTYHSTRHDRPEALVGMWGVLPVLGVVLVVLGPCVYAMDEEFSFTTHDRVIYAVPFFGFDKGGTVNVTIKKLQVQGHPTYLYASLLSWEEKGALDNLKDTPAVQCSYPSYMRVEIPPSEEEGPREPIYYRINHRKRYYFALVNCKKRAVTATINVVFINPGGQHLSLGEIHLPSVYVVMLCLYGVVSLLWIMYFWKHRRGSTHVQKIIVLALVTKTFETLLSVIYYDRYSKYGHVEDLLFIGREFVIILSETLFLATLLLMAMGWSVLRDTLIIRERQLFWGGFAVYALFGILKTICNTTTLCGIYTLSFYVIKFLITFGIIVAMNANIERLRAAPFDNAWFSHIETFEKLKMFKNFRWAFLAYLVHPIFLLFVEVTVLSWEQDWVLMLLRELIILLIYVMIGYTFRQRALYEYAIAPDGDDPSGMRAFEGEEDRAPPPPPPPPPYSNDGRRPYVSPQQAEESSSSSSSPSSSSPIAVSLPNDQPQPEIENTDNTTHDTARRRYGMTLE